MLLEQVYVIDGESQVGKVVEAAAKEAGAPIKVAGFVRFALGEGIERPPTDFAAEVAAQLQLADRPRAATERKPVRRRPGLVYLVRGSRNGREGLD